jgi:hypothetical protein|tara:strand:- start:3888 stop:4190 length:303 start_codon:yes stop_codon:yes gene_type:complete
MKKILLLSSLVLLNACQTLPAWVGTSAGTYETYKTITFSKTGIDVALAANDMPTTNDFALSKITGYDCKLIRVLDEGLEAVCKEYKYDQHPSEREDKDNE